jgi:transcriptional regulator with XRE-family HTH domain
VVVDASDRDQLRQLGSLVRRYRTERGMSSRELARRAQVSLGTVSHLETGSHRPTVTTFTRIIEALELDTAAARALWSLYGDRDDGRERIAVSADRIMHEIHALANARLRAWLRADAATAHALSDELERLWSVYRVALTRSAKDCQTRSVE